MAKKLSLKPIEKKLNQLRSAVQKELARTTQVRKKKRLAKQIKGLTTLIAHARGICHLYDVGG